MEDTLYNDFAKVEHYETAEKKKYNVFFAGGVELSVSEEEFFEFGLYETREKLGISLETLIEKLSIKRARIKAVSWLKGSLKPVKSVILKLREEGYDENIIENVVSELKEERILDDSKYCMKQVARLSESGKSSRALIVHELHEKGIDEEITLNCLEAVGFDDSAVAEKIIKKKLLCGDSPAKIQRYLYSKGFSKSIILKLFRNIDIGSNDEDIE